MATAVSSPGGTPLVSAAGRRYALFLLFVAYTINYVDRQVITILQEPIKRELGLSDTQLGLVTGLSFALFYAVMGVPIARMADRRSRKLIISVSMALWSVMTTLCAAATSFATLLLYRIGVGVGEAGLTPPAHSLISDYYEPGKRASALAIYSASGSFGLMVGFLAGGWINQFFGWRWAIVVVGVPGILIALIIWLTMREPRRGQYDAPTAGAGEAQGVFAAMRGLLANPGFRWLALGCAFHTFVIYGQGNWTPPFLGRIHGMSTGELGTWLAILSVGPGVLGMIGAGYLADWLAKWRPHARIEVAIGCVLLAIPFEVGAFMAGDKATALIFLGLTFAPAGAYLGPSIAAAHALVPVQVRASASALLMLGINLVGLGLGPLAVGVMSDAWAASAGTESLRHALLAIIPAQGLAILCFLRAIQVSEGQCAPALRLPAGGRSG